VVRLDHPLRWVRVTNGLLGGGRRERGEAYGLSPSLSVGSIVCALASAALGSLFATGDAALNALSEARLSALTSEPGPSQVAFRRYTRDRTRVLSRWLVGRIVAISLAAALIDEAAEQSGTLAGFGVALAALVAVLIYGTLTEIFITVAKRRPETVGALALRALWPLEWAVAPLAEPLAMIGRFIDRRFPAPRVDADHAESEVEWVVNQGEKTGALANEPAEIIRNVLDFKDLVVRSVMVPRARVLGVEIGTSLADVMEIVAKAGHSRYPVYRDTLDNLVGLLYVKDLFKVVGVGKAAVTALVDVIRTGLMFVVETQPTSTLLKDMRAKGMHLAVVIDEFGGTSGVVTLEDILEEIVGTIREQGRPSQVEQIGESRFVADAAMSLSDVSELLGKDLPAGAEFESLGGLLVHRAGRVPQVGTELNVDGLRFVVREAEETHVVKVEIDATGERAARPARPAS
jgi:putative hemolysin